MKNTLRLIPAEKEVKRFLLIFYLVGVLGFLIPYTHNLFTKLIPLALLLNVFLLLYFHKPTNTKSFAIMALIALLGYAIEVVGVKTGVVFGHYWYGNSLGPKLFEVPIMIGINWVLLTYCASIIVSSFIKSMLARIIVGASMVTFYDFVMEPVAIYTNMWHWQSGVIPLKNYLMWFLLAAFFVFIFTRFSKNNLNGLALHVLLLQFLFFVILNLKINYF